jgi:uncharacterized repeat protein (TIGR03803 family)
MQLGLRSLLVPAFAAAMTCTAVAAPEAAAPHYQIVHKFKGPAGHDGRYPEQGVTFLDDGSLVVTTDDGPTTKGGAIFHVATDGTETMWHEFVPATEGSYSFGLLVKAPDGLLYGTLNMAGPTGGGTVFRIAPDGTGFAIVHVFAHVGGGSNPDGYGPNGLVVGRDGALYGSTRDGGDTSEYGKGTIYRMTLSGDVTWLHRFAPDGSEGWQPTTTLTQAADGMLYGLTYQGGTNNRGTFFRVATDGTGFEVLHPFVTSEGTGAKVPVTQAPDGTIYGVNTIKGFYGSGTLWSWTPAAGLRVVHVFGGTPDAPQGPSSAVLPGANGWLYGVSQRGGVRDAGALYRVDAGTGATETLYSFGTKPVRGLTPSADRLATDADGAIYGACFGGGHPDHESTDGGDGVIWRFTRAARP